MKKLIICAAIAGITSYGIYYIANKKVEDNIQVALEKTAKDMGNYDFSGDVSTNILMGTLKIENFELKNPAITQTGDLEITGIQFYNQEKILSDDVSIRFNNYKVQDPTFDLISDNMIKIKKTGDSSIAIILESKIIENKTNDKLIQNLELNIDSVGNLYDNFNKDLTNSILVEKYTTDNLKYIKDISGAKLTNASLTLDNEKLLQKGLKDNIKIQYPEATDKEINDYIVSNARIYVNQNFPEEFRPKLMKFIESENDKITISINNISGKNVTETYQTMLFSQNPAKDISMLYKLEIK